MSWTTPTDVRQQLQRLWERGDLLRGMAGGAAIFPLRLGLKAPQSSDLSERFEAVREWTTALLSQPQLRIEWSKVRHRVQGLQRVPQSLWLDTPQMAFVVLEKLPQAECFARLVEVTRNTLPVLLPWLASRPLRAIELAEQWPRLLAIVQWQIARPRCGLYLRQVDIAGVHSKFIEAHRGVLAELFDLALPADAIDVRYSGVNQFAARYGFRDKPARIRIRSLDPQVSPLPGIGHPDLSLDADSFAQLQTTARRVFITENEINFLAFPDVERSLVIFGAGYGWDTLARARWLEPCTIHYWGDIDTHGFAILDQLRARFAHVASLLMDSETYLAHADRRVAEDTPVRHALTRLNADENSLFEQLRAGHYRERQRLEQERVGFDWVRRRLQQVIESSG